MGQASFAEGLAEGFPNSELDYLTHVFRNISNYIVH